MTNWVEARQDELFRHAPFETQRFEVGEVLEAIDVAIVTVVEQDEVTQTMKVFDAGERLEFWAPGDCEFSERLQLCQRVQVCYSEIVDDQPLKTGEGANDRDGGVVDAGDP